LYVPISANSRPSFALAGRFGFQSSNVKIELVIFDLEPFFFYLCYCIQVLLKHANDLGILRYEFALFDCVVNQFHSFILTLIDPANTDLGFCSEQLQVRNGSAAMDKPLPDFFYTQRVYKLVKEGELTSQGKLGHMRFCEVRLN
jgi:hypothetical protein